MVDIFALAVSHGLILLAAWRLLARSDLDDDSGKSRRTFAGVDDGDPPGA